MQATFSKTQIFNLILLIEALVLTLATAWSFIFSLELMPYLQKVDAVGLIIGILVGLSISLSSIATTHMAIKWKAKAGWLGNYMELITTVMAPIFSKFSVGDIICVALVSGFCEEVFYRGVLQNQFGILIASLIFGICHFAGSRYFFYVIWAAIAGAVFGYLVILTGSLWPAILAHVTNNFVSLAYLRFKLDFSASETDNDQST